MPLVFTEGSGLGNPKSTTWAKCAQGPRAAATTLLATVGRAGRRPPLLISTYYVTGILGRESDTRRQCRVGAVWRPRSNHTPVTPCGLGGRQRQDAASCPVSTDTRSASRKRAASRVSSDAATASPRVGAGGFGEEFRTRSPSRRAAGVTVLAVAEYHTHRGAGHTRPKRRILAVLSLVQRGLTQHPEARGVQSPPAYGFEDQRKSWRQRGSHAAPRPVGKQPAA